MTNEYSPFQWGIGLISAFMFMWGLYHIFVFIALNGLSVLESAVITFKSVSTTEQVIMILAGGLFLMVVLYSVTMNAVRGGPW